MSTFELTKEDIDMMRSLRARGCAVCVFLPEEMENSDPDQVEDAMIEGGWRQIHFDDDYADEQATKGENACAP